MCRNDCNVIFRHSRARQGKTRQNKARQGKARGEDHFIAN